ncbi:ATP-binding protein [Deferribacter autotrophicus]|uniref:ATP-binding protein n=1 Tax=Deferribacter autotrophicus TaxID=500465 RepID=A0A5A8F3P7_9BACT|nr:ATP-binding protein [Deferribacter autotrophicus]KAA0257653.1 ATP-binding protein [Deferribacter autotrophicus]
MFIGRDYELKKLNELYSEDKFHFVVIYGRRRVGKTALLSEFCKRKPSLFFVAEEYSDEIALKNFSRTIFAHFNLKGLGSFDSWENAFLFLGERAKENRLVVVIDEFQYLVNSNRNIPSTLQKLIDHLLKNTKLFLIVCGSYVSFMEREILGYKSPLYGRRTAQMEIIPFRFFESTQFFPKISIEEQVYIFSVFGGTPQYLVTFDPEIDLYENIKTKILDKSSYLFEEPKFLLKQELREPSIYNSILESIASGCTKLNEIATKIGIETSKTAKYLKTLIELRIVEQLKPEKIGKSSRSSIYRIKDNFFRFWYRFVFENKGLIEQDMPQYVVENKIKPYMNSYVGLIFEEIAVEYLKILNKQRKLPFIFDRIGKWWGNNPVKKREEEIDIVAYDEENLLVGECKWQNKKVDLPVLNQLIEKSALFDKPNKYYVLFSRSGFTESMIKFAMNNPSVILIGLDDMEDVRT